MSEKEIQELITKDQVRKTVSTNFKYLRSQLGLSQGDMGNRIGESRQNYAKVEEGQNISAQVVINMAMYCKISLNNIFLNDISKQGE
jgi:DNA-binding XRE family transcriptional regulator